MSRRSLKIAAATLAVMFLAGPALTASRPGQNAGHHGGSGNVQRPSQRPANVQRSSPQRPSNIQSPTKASGGRAPSSGKPAAQQPSAPAHRPSGSVQRPEFPQQASRPQAGNKPALTGQDRPNEPIDLGGRVPDHPKFPGDDKMAGPADRLPANLAKPATRPAAPGMDLSQLPNSPGSTRLPGATRPGQTQPGGKIKDRRPGAVPPRDQLEKYPGVADNLNRRPGGYDKWQQNRDDRWNSWHDQRAEHLDQFQVNRDDRWNNITALQDNRQDFYTNRREDWQNWSNDVRDYRQNRAWEVLDNVRDYNANLFVPDWYYRNRWWGGPVYGASINPWVWWRPAAWTGLAAFLGGAAVATQLDRDYGTQVYYDQTNYYIEGQPVATAPQYRQQALELAATEPSEEPFIPAEQGDNGGWYPLGVWALTQEEKGDAVMFYQLAVNKSGEVSGAYSNALTGESSPVTGRVDFATQRVAWRTGDSDSTALEANLAGLTKEFTPVFVHYGTGQTQEWLLVRMEDPT